MTIKGQWVRQAIANHTGNLNLSFFANPNPVTGPGATGSTMLFWNLSKMLAVKTVEIHVGTASGPIIAKGGATGSARVSLPATYGTEFILVDTTAGTHRPLGAVTLHVH
jgi:hypothetical protein